MGGRLTGVANRRVPLVLAAAYVALVSGGSLLLAHLDEAADLDAKGGVALLAVLDAANGMDPENVLGAALALLAATTFNAAAIWTVARPSYRQLSRYIAIVAATLSAYLTLCVALGIRAEVWVAALLALTTPTVVAEKFARRRLKLSIPSRFAVYLIFTNVLCAMSFSISGGHVALWLPSLLFALIYIVLILPSQKSRTATWIIVSARVAVAVLAAVALIVSFREYGDGGETPQYAPPEAPWRSLYFAVMLTFYCALPMVVLLTRFSSRGLRSWRRPDAILAYTGAMMVAVPILVCFTPHGVNLVLGSAVWLSGVFLVAQNIYDRKFAAARRIVVIAFALFVLLFGLLSLDRLFYSPNDRYISAALLLLQAYGPLLGVVFGAAVAIYVAVDSKRLKERSQSARLMMRGSVRLQIEVGVLALSVIFLALEYTFFALFIATASQPALPTDWSFTRVNLDGFGGVNALSWAATAHLVNVALVLGFWSFRALKDWWLGRTPSDDDLLSVATEDAAS